MKEFRLEETVRASQAKVWDALVNPEKTRVYLNGCYAVGEWQENADLSFYQLKNGHPVRIAHGTLKVWQPQHLLVYSLFPSESTLPDIERNYLQLLIEVTPQSAQVTNLKIIQTGFDQADQGTQRYEESLAGWKQILPAFIKIVETTA